MKLSAAPLIYSRTLRIGFNPNFLVYPEGVNNLSNFRNWARGFVESALVKADYLFSNGCRIGSFQNKEYIIIGVCSLAEFLCNDQNYYFVDKNRSNYGFFGYVFKKESFKPFIIQKFENNKVPQVFRELYGYVIEHWQDNEPDPEKNSHSQPYKEITFDFEEISLESGKLSEDVPRPSKNEIVILPQEQYNQYSHLISEGYSFCSNIPSIQDANNSLFDYVFIPKISKIEVTIKSDFIPSKSENSYKKEKSIDLERVKTDINKLSPEEKQEVINDTIDGFSPPGKIKTAVYLTTSFFRKKPSRFSNTTQNEKPSLPKDSSSLLPKGQKSNQENQPSLIISSKKTK